jgi:archaellum component FlaC
MKNLNELNTEIEMIKRDINDIKNNHLTHIESDLKDVKVEVFRFKYIAYGAIVVFVLATDSFKELLRLL